MIENLMHFPAEVGQTLTDQLKCRFGQLFLMQCCHLTKLYKIISSVDILLLSPYLLQRQTSFCWSLYIISYVCQKMGIIKYSVNGMDVKTSKSAYFCHNSNH